MDEWIGYRKNTVSRRHCSESAITLRVNGKSRPSGLVNGADILSLRSAVIGGCEISGLRVEGVKDNVEESERTRHFEREESSDFV